MDLDSHAVVEELQHLLPNAVVAGGCFASLLPHPSSVARDERVTVFEQAKSAATSQCLRDLLDKAGLAAVEPRRGEAGDRLWPKGFVGSVSHKSTTVLAALARTVDMEALGIDLERDDGAAISPMIVGEARPPTSTVRLGVLLTFSAKEAVFKAQFPLTHRRLAFEDVVLRWSRDSDDSYQATARCGGLVLFTVRVRVVAGWVVSAAFL